MRFIQKKLQGINFENNIIGFLRSNRLVKYSGNSGRIWYKKGNKNILRKNPEKFSITGIRIPSCEMVYTIIDFLNSSKTYDLINFLVKIRIENTNI